MTDIVPEPDELAALHLATNLVRLDGDETGLIKLGAAGSAVATVPSAPITMWPQVVSQRPAQAARAGFVGSPPNHEASVRRKGTRSISRLFIASHIARP